MNYSKKNFLCETIISSLVGLDYRNFLSFAMENSDQLSLKIINTNKYPRTFGIETTLIGLIDHGQIKNVNDRYYFQLPNELMNKLLYRFQNICGINKNVIGIKQTDNVCLFDLSFYKNGQCWLSSESDNIVNIEKSYYLNYANSVSWENKEWYSNINEIFKKQVFSKNKILDIYKAVVKERASSILSGNVLYYEYFENLPKAIKKRKELKLFFTEDQWEIINRSETLDLTTQTKEYLDITQRCDEIINYIEIKYFNIIEAFLVRRFNECFRHTLNLEKM